MESRAAQVIIRRPHGRSTRKRYLQRPPARLTLFPRDLFLAIGV